MSLLRETFLQRVQLHFCPLKYVYSKVRFLQKIYVLYLRESKVDLISHLQNNYPPAISKEHIELINTAMIICQQSHHQSAKYTKQSANAVSNQQVANNTQHAERPIATRFSSREQRAKNNSSKPCAKTNKKTTKEQFVSSTNHKAMCTYQNRQLASRTYRAESARKEKTANIRQHISKNRNKQ